MPITTRVSLLRETPGAFETAVVELDDPRQGELTVNSELGKGSRFAMRFPPVRVRRD